MVLHADAGKLWPDKVVAVVKTKRLRETELNLAKAFENYSVETDLDYTVRPMGEDTGCQEFSSVTGCLVTMTLHLSPMPVSPMFNVTHQVHVSAAGQILHVRCGLPVADLLLHVFVKLTLGSQPHMPERD